MQRFYPIDWRDEFARVRPYLSGKGRRIRVNYRGIQCAPFIFLKTLISEYQVHTADASRVAIRIDREVYKIPYLSGIRDEFAAGLGLPPLSNQNSAQNPGDVRFFTDVRARGDVRADFSNVTVNTYISENHDQMLERRRVWVQQLCSILRGHVEHSGMMIVLNHGPRDEQDEFWRFLWADGLERISKLFLVHMVDTSDSHAGLHELAPTPELELDLPAALSHSAQEHAIEDLAEMILREFPSISREVAWARADTLVRSHVNDIPRLHSQWGALLLRLSVEQYS